MPGRSIPPESNFCNDRNGRGHPEFSQRRAILQSTLKAFSDAKPANRYSILADINLRRWHDECKKDDPPGRILILPGDWGDVTLSLTKEYGKCFAVLNMANAYVPGGGYVEGCIAQEENIFRRTDCHFYITDEEYDSASDRYYQEVTQLLSAKDGVVYLDQEKPRICIRGVEDRSREDLGYPWLSEDEVFPFFELRASAQDLRYGRVFDEDEARWRIAAQLRTLQQKGVKHAVLGAFGCGAFQNPSREVARIYREEIETCRADFSVIAFAIFAAGYGPDNYAPFAEVFADLTEV